MSKRAEALRKIADGFYDLADTYTDEQEEAREKATESYLARNQEVPEEQEKEQAPEEETPDPVVENPKAEKKGPTKEDVKTALVALQDAEGVQVAKGVLKDFDATSVGTLDEDQYAAVIKACKGLMS